MGDNSEYMYISRAATAKTSPQSSSTALRPSARAQDGLGHPSSLPLPSRSPALSVASTAQDDDDIEASPTIPPLPAPSLPDRVTQILSTPPPVAGDFATASWGSPYLKSDLNLHRSSFSSEASDDSPIHHLEIDTPFLRPQPAGQPVFQPETQPSVKAAAAVLVNRARRQIRGLTEDWIRTHTTGVVNAEPKHWFSEGSETERSSLSGSELGWLDDADSRTPRADGPSTSSQTRRPRGRSSVETLKPTPLIGRNAAYTMGMAASEPPGNPDLPSDSSSTADPSFVLPAAKDEADETIRDAVQTRLPVTPIKGAQKPPTKGALQTPRIKKRVPWKGKNILVLVPRDDQRGLPGKSPIPLRSDEIERMFSSWQELGYSVEGFDLLVEGYQPPGTDDSQSRQDWPTAEDVIRERTERPYKVTLPDLNAWKEYVNELQEAKLRALGVSFAEKVPEPPSASTPTSNPSRQPSAQHPSLPFSPPIPTSSASSNHAVAGYPFPGQLAPTSQSPGLPLVASPVPFATAPGKFNSRQSISLPASASPFQLPQISPQGWHGAIGSLPGLNRNDSPNLASLAGVLSPQSPHSIDRVQQAGSPAFNMHSRHQSLQYLPQHVTARASPRLQEVIEEEGTTSKSPSMTPEPTRLNPGGLQAEIDDAEYHLEDQLRNQLEHEDYNPRTHEQSSAVETGPLKALRGQDASANLAVAQHFASEPEQPLVLHHPRPHSRGHSLSQNFFRDHDGAQESTEEDGHGKLDVLSEVPEPAKDDEREMQSNHVNLDSPAKNFQMPPTLNQHIAKLSSNSNVWQDSASVASSGRRMSHESKPSLSKFNVEAPEFKFNPSAGFAFKAPNSSSNPPQPTTSQPGDVASPSIGSTGQFGGPARFHATAPSFSPGQSDFNFSSSGPKFRPDAPAFTPFQPASAAVISPAGPGRDKGKRDSIFGNLEIKASDIVKPVKKSKAIPIVRPSSRTSAKSENAQKSDDANHGDSDDGFEHEVRSKRTKSVAPGIDDVPLFAERPDDDIPGSAITRDEQSGAEDGSTAEGDNALNPADMSMSSTILSDHMETKANTAATSEVSPVGDGKVNNWLPLDFDTKFEAHSFESAGFGHQTDHNKSLSATAKPFIPMEARNTEQHSDSAAEAMDSAANEPAPQPRPKLTPKGLSGSRFASSPFKMDGLSGSRFATSSPAGSPGLTSGEFRGGETIIKSVETEPTGVDAEPTFDEIDAVMQHLENDPSMGINKSAEPTLRQPPTAVMEPDATGDDLQLTANWLLRDGTSMTPRQNAVSSAPPISSTEAEDPFVDPTPRTQSPDVDDEQDASELRSEPASDWEGVFTEDEQDKVASRAQFFDGRVNQVVGSLLASRLAPLEKSLYCIQHALASKARRTPSSRRDMRSVSIEIRESDADDEDDDEPVPRRSTSPRRDRKMEQTRLDREQIRLAVTEALATQQIAHPAVDTVAGAVPASEESAVLRAIQDMREQLASANVAQTEKQSLKGHGGSEGQDAHDRAMDELVFKKLEELQDKLAQSEEKMFSEQLKLEKEIADRRAAQDEAAELNRKLLAAETRVEVEIINRSVFDQRVADLEERLRQQENKTEEEVKVRRAAEDRLSEVQRLLRISSEEENRLRDVVEEKERKIKCLEDEGGKVTQRMALLEASRASSTQAQSDMTNHVNALEADLRAVRQDNNHWRGEAERAEEAAGHKAGELAHVQQENKQLQKSLTGLTSQLEENERLRESWRTKFMSLQDDMARAARDIAEENSRRTRRDQAMLARQEVLDARLQAEAKTRERLEVEMERLQLNERSGMRAVNECKRLEDLLAELRGDNHKLQRTALRYQREFEEARESGASEVRRTRMTMQTEIDAANNQVNVIREELEEQNVKVRAELDNVKLEADTCKERNDMLLEEAQVLRKTELEGLKSKHQNELEDMQLRYERQISTASEDAQKSEQLLLERLSLSASKTKHLQDRIVHLEEKLDIARAAAAAAAQAAKSSSSGVPQASAAPCPPPVAPRKVDLPEKISPQALRESIMVLQEQLQAREQRIEELEQVVSGCDPDAATKISKRDDEIMWLRELLAVRHGDLQDIITALSCDRLDREAVRDAAIRLKANLQMEEQERIRAQNGGSAISLPNIAQSIQAASPRVAQTIGPIAAAWGNWRKSGQPALRGSSRAAHRPSSSGTPLKRVAGAESQMGGLLTPPASSVRHSPPLHGNMPQPTAFSSTGRRYTAQQGGHARGPSMESRRSDMTAARLASPQRIEAMSPPMMRDDAGYDSDAQPGDFEDQDFFEDEEE
ncbi:hypothetical protein L249_4744 [Ophiocordyceps polyrhachis-furcata BCC 54312]|uniref:Myosin class II heavy chain n=1 Tax=Ophiocordyceps polyrhachis-furcata BCC 54312 TaxID=1330021 RepID=A0A367L2T5_9HYPO|nr:hypothetical protein L249_4744 [Ophiocordyceps polyrhachis-furcata BCC 54312]